MKKIIALAVIGLAMAAVDTHAQTLPVMPQKFAVQDGEKTAAVEPAVTISANYALSRISLSQKYQSSGSILSWRDINLHGTQLNVEFNKASSIFNKTNIGVGFHKSFHGYHTDDDANNLSKVISVDSTEATLFDFKYEILYENKNPNFTPKLALGLDFNYLKLENYNNRSFMPYKSYLYYRDIEGLVNKYDVYKFGWYIGMQMKVITGIFYVDVSGQIGSGIYLALGDWIHRPDFKHPVSFYDFGLSLRSGGDLEIGLKLSRFTFFTKALLFYEISPFGTEGQLLSNGKTAVQNTFFDFSHAAFSAGLKVSF